MKTAPCAHCGEPAALEPSNPWRPFCSERCKLLDLGHWFAGQYAIPDVAPDAEPDEEPPPPQRRPRQ